MVTKRCACDEKCHKTNKYNCNIGTSLVYIKSCYVTKWCKITKHGLVIKMCACDENCDKKCHENVKNITNVFTLWMISILYKT